MDLARYVVDAVILEGRSCREVARAHGCSKSWVAKMVTRFREAGYRGLERRSKAALRIPHRTPARVEDHIVRLRKELEGEGLDVGAETIPHHVLIACGAAPSVSTIWRVLKRWGFVTPQPHKRPRSSWIRFEATLPNECWQSDVTHFRLGCDTEVQIVNVLNDYSRLCVASRALPVTIARDVLENFREAASR